MSERAKEILDRRDLAEAEHQEWLDRHAAQLADQECDELLDRLEQERSEKAKDQVRNTNLKSSEPAELVRREYDLSPSEPRSTMDDESSRAWNEWAENIARREANAMAGMVCDAIGAEMGELHKKQNEDWTAAVDELRSEIADLRGVVDDLASEVGDLRSEIEQINANNYPG